MVRIKTTPKRLRRKYIIKQRLQTPKTVKVTIHSEIQTHFKKIALNASL